MIWKPDFDAGGADHFVGLIVLATDLASETILGELWQTIWLVLRIHVHI